MNPMTSWRNWRVRVSERIIEIICLRLVLELSLVDVVVLSKAK